MWFTSSHELNPSCSALYYKDAQILENVTSKKNIETSVMKKKNKSFYISPDFYALDTFQEDAAPSRVSSRSLL